MILTAHALAKLLLEHPDHPVKFLDYEGMETHVTGITTEPNADIEGKCVELTISH